MSRRMQCVDGGVLDGGLHTVIGRQDQQQDFTSLRNAEVQFLPLV